MADKNRANIMYIGKYSGAGRYIAKNAGMEHGLFGKYNGRDFGDIESIENAANYVKLKTSKGTNMYRGIISLTEHDAMYKGFFDREDWEDFMQGQVFSMADKIGIPASRLEYMCAVHMERGHPHLHFTMWDKKQGIKKPFVHESISNSIRTDLNKTIFHDELAQLNEIKNISREAITSGSKDFFSDFFEPLQSMTKKEFEAYAEELKQNPSMASGYMFSSKISDETLDNLALQIFEFKEKIPKSGRVTYKTLTPELKEELKGIVKDIINNNEDFSREFDIYIDTNMELTSYYVSEDDLEEAQKQAALSAEEDILKRLSNQLLKEIKETNTKQYEVQQEQYEQQQEQYKQQQEEKQQAYMRHETFMMIKSLFSFFSRFNESHQKRAIALDRSKGDLSKQAKKELAIKLEHAGSIDWER